ncbi:Flp pilus assembly protein TadD [Nostoc sp. PCC 7524]|uniref:tetratricopeptide repeat protein n=1 Tax=Nostoc sp. (strain ATCC 29411 / PCC 7524) TaxID=28072 RepID=UPI00029F1EC3|nr:tetratricopeptide repeat protein [Nostoc sp. PCC 7524]AFY49383.1 Flp pilus assembly protein TadD [Nostoc sp. PCC 7524]
MNSDFNNWDDDLPPEPEAAYQDLVRALKRKSGFGLYFVQCTPVEADNLIIKLPQDIPHKHIEVLRLVEAIDNLYQRVAEFVQNKQIDILLIKGLEYSLYKYEKRTFGEITEGQFSNLTSVPHILNHLNQQRERFRDDFPFCFVFLLRSFSINYLIHRAPDFFDWRSGVFELPTTPELVERESNRLILLGNYEAYLKLSQEEKIEKVLEFQDLLAEQHQTEDRKVGLLFELGNLLYAAKEFEAAISSYDQALKFKPDKHEAWYNRGIALRNLGRNEEAISSYDQSVKFNPDDHQAWNNRGNTLFNLGRNEEAISSYDQAVKIKPDKHETWNNRGIALRNLGRNEEAISSYDQALKFQPDLHQAWNNRGIALFNLGRNEEAISSYDQALKFQPDFHEAWYNRGNALRNLGRNEEAISSYDQALKFQPDFHEAWNNRGVALFNLERNEEAISSYDQALKFQPDLHQAWYNKACCYALQNNVEKAIENLQIAINLNPEQCRTWAKTDSDFDSIRNDELFQELMEK